jgi:hypothetical protein
LERLDNINLELEEWKQKYEDLEGEKQKLFEEMQNEISNKNVDLNNLQNCNNEMFKYIRQLEKSEHHFIVKDMANISKRQQKRRIQELGSRAKKALWFTKRFGLEIESLNFFNYKSGDKYSFSNKDTSPVEISPSSSSSSPSSAHTPEAMPYEEECLTSSPIDVSNSSSPTTCPSTSEAVKTRFKQYENLTELEKCKVESILFLMDTFAVGDAFIQELCMTVDGMPKSYLIKQCRDKLNSTCIVKPTPGSEAGAHISFKASLINKLRQLVSITKLLISLWLLKIMFSLGSIHN